MYMEQGTRELGVYEEMEISKVRAARAHVRCGATREAGRSHPVTALTIHTDFE